MVDTNSKSIKFMFASNRCPLVFVCVDMCAVIVFFFRDYSCKLCALECTCKVVGRKLFYSFLSCSVRGNSFFSFENYFSSSKTRIIIINKKYAMCPSVAPENCTFFTCFEWNSWVWLIWFNYLTVEINTLVLSHSYFTCAVYIAHDRALIN